MTRSEMVAKLRDEFVDVMARRYGNRDVSATDRLITETEHAARAFLEAIEEEKAEDHEWAEDLKIGKPLEPGRITIANLEAELSALKERIGEAIIVLRNYGGSRCSYMSNALRILDGRDA